MSIKQDVFHERLMSLVGDLPVSSWLAKIGLSPNLAKTIGRGNPPKADALVAISRATGKSVDWLLGLDEEIPLLARIHEADGDQAKEFAYIERYRTREGEPELTLAFRRMWIKNYLRTDPGKLVVVRIEDDLMSPVFIRRDNVLVNTEYANQPGNGLYALRIKDDIVIRRTQKLANGSLRIICENEKYPADEIDLGAMANDYNFEIIGKVVWYSRQI
ncbi:helix-turn-helix transcriptional regulator [Burkholderia ubonensis]|uniref:Repressor n=1 Tax=Burkholderia ubonensis TaxID=101571 RepID=A0AAW3NBC5_9BURK|nr:S24 family peptidase [Burkholderia ubonensis]KVT57911.1 repressor [Burkholderia ubonensis]